MNRNAVELAAVTELRIVGVGGCVPLKTCTPRKTTRVVKLRTSD